MKICRVIIHPRPLFRRRQGKKKKVKERKWFFFFFNLLLFHFPIYYCTDVRDGLLWNNHPSKGDEENLLLLKVPLGLLRHLGGEGKGEVREYYIYVLFVGLFSSRFSTSLLSGDDRRKRFWWKSV